MLNIRSKHSERKNDRLHNMDTRSFLHCNYYLNELITLKSKGGTEWNFILMKEWKVYIWNDIANFTNSHAWESLNSVFSLIYINVDSSRETVFGRHKRFPKIFSKICNTTFFPFFSISKEIQELGEDRPVLDASVGERYR